MPETWLRLNKMDASVQKISIEVNGQPKFTDADTTIAELLSELFSATKSNDTPRPFAAVAVEVNSEIIPRDQFESTVLQNSDHVEVVTLVGGG